MMSENGTRHTHIHPTAQVHRERARGGRAHPSPSLPSLFLSSLFPLPVMQVFDVNLNDLVGISDLDIFASVGKAAAHDVVLPFSIKDGQLNIGGETSDFDGTLSVEFAKVTANWSSGHIIILYML